MITLEDLSKGDTFTIVGFAGEGVKNKICNLINPENILEIVSKQVFKGPIVIKAENYEIAIGRGMARKIYVKKYE